MISKQVVFNVGGALSVYTEFDGKKILNDLGKSDDFNPVIDFLLPLYKKRNENNDGKYLVDQLIVSHPHKDHISAIEDFDEYFYTYLLTCPNDNKKHDDGQAHSEDEIINWDLVGNKEDSSIIKLKQMIENRKLPLRSICSNGQQFIYWIPPRIIENNQDLISESYVNNLSILTLFRINGHSVLLPGDLQKNGLEYLLNNNYQQNTSLVNHLANHSLCILIAPHHGLKSSFCLELFDKIRDKKTKCLNIVSEKKNNPDESRDVDTRYSSREYCKGKNDLPSNNGEDGNYQRKTSAGHICIDYSDGSMPHFKIIKDTQELIDWFC